MRLLQSFLISLFLLVSSCALFSPREYQFTPNVERTDRDIAEVTDRLEFFLELDRFIYYVTEFTHHQRGKVSDEVIAALKDLTPQHVLSHASSFPRTKLNNAMKYDELITTYLRSRGALSANQSLSWGYNFLKKKINDGFLVRDDKLKSEYILEELANEEVVDRNWTQFDVDTLNPDEQSLDSAQYISDRMTRGVFWEAIEADRTIEFHPTNPREFLKNVKRDGGEVIGEVKTKGSNYNKIYLVKYPGEDKYRVAITNVGGEERMQHLMAHVSLSNIFNKSLANVNLELKGDFEVERARMKSRFVNKLNHLPKATRVIIGQTAAIQNRFYLHWKLTNLKKLYDKKDKNLTN